MIDCAVTTPKENKQREEGKIPAYRPLSRCYSRNGCTKGSPSDEYSAASPITWCAENSRSDCKNEKQQEVIRTAGYLPLEVDDTSLLGRAKRPHDCLEKLLTLLVVEQLAERHSDCRRSSEAITNAESMPETVKAALWASVTFFPFLIRELIMMEGSHPRKTTSQSFDGCSVFLIKSWTV